MPTTEEQSPLWERPLTRRGILGAVGLAGLAGMSGRVTEAAAAAPGDVGGMYNVTTYGAKGDGVTDDRAAIQHAIDDAFTVGGAVVLPAGTFSVGATLQLRYNTMLLGTGPDPNGTAGMGTTILGAPGIDVVALPTQGTIASGMTIRDLRIKGGARQLVSLVVSSHVNVENVHFDGPSSTCIHVEGAIELWSLRSVRFNGGQYGFRMANVPHGSSDYIDKSTFTDVLATGQLVNGWRIECRTSDTVTWYNPVINQCGQHGFYADGGIAGWVFVNGNTENNGNTGRTARTTGSIAAGSTTLRLGSGAGFANGDPIVVAGAGSYKDLATTVVAGGGTTILTLADAAGYTVTNVPVTNCQFDDFSFDNTISTPGDLTFIGGEIGNGSHVRYAVKGDLVNQMTFVGVGAAAAAPIYALDQIAVIGGDIGVRSHPSVGQLVGRGNVLASPGSSQEMQRALVCSPPGKPLVFFSRDSTDDFTGTFQPVEFRSKDPNRTRTFYVDPGGYGIVQEQTAGYAQFNGTARFGNALYPSTPGHGLQTAASIYAGSGAPKNAAGRDGDFYFRSDGGTGARLYHKVSGSWTGVL
jgi:pectate lyase-like protein